MATPPNWARTLKLRPCAYSTALSKLFAGLNVMDPLRFSTEPIAAMPSRTYSLGGLAVRTHMTLKARINGLRRFVTAAKNKTTPSWGGEQFLKVPMITDSRKVQRDNYAHHRAHLLFSGLSQDHGCGSVPSRRARNRLKQPSQLFTRVDAVTPEGLGAHNRSP